MLQNELSFKDHQDGIIVAQALLRADYVVLLSTEEDLLILNYEWSESGWADRNDVVFMNRTDFKDQYFNCE